MPTTKIATNTENINTQTLRPSFVHGFRNDSPTFRKCCRQTHEHPWGDRVFTPKQIFSQPVREVHKHISTLFTLVTLNALPEAPVMVVTSHAWRQNGCTDSVGPRTSRAGGDLGSFWFLCSRNSNSATRRKSGFFWSEVSDSFCTGQNLRPA